MPNEVEILGDKKVVHKKYVLKKRSGVKTDYKVNYSEDLNEKQLEAVMSNEGALLVIAGAGAGEFSNAYKDVIEKLDIPVVISSRTGDGIILPENLLCKNTIAADNLPPQKAAILLRLAIANGIEKNSLQELFIKY